MMNAAASRRDNPAADSYLKIPKNLLTAVPRRGPEAGDLVH